MKKCPKYKLKLIFLGNSAVGKTSLYLRQADKHFPHKNTFTLRCDFVTQIYQVDNSPTQIQFWDTAGEERFRPLGKAYYRSANIIFVCFDLANRSSFDELSYWIDSAKENSPKGRIFLIGCKSDLSRDISPSQIESVCQQYKISYLQTSAKEGTGVSQAFQKAVVETVSYGILDNSVEQFIPIKNLKNIKKKKQKEGYSSMCW